MQQRVKCLSIGGGQSDCNQPLKLLSVPGNINYFGYANYLLKHVGIGHNSLGTTNPHNCQDELRTLNGHI